MENEICHLKLEEIIPNDYQTREVLNETSLKELEKSIEQHGVIQPIIVRKKDDKYEIVDGLRRYKASLMANLTKIPAIVRNYDDNESVRISLIDNLQRQDFSPIEEARIYKRILEKERMTQEELANNIGKSQSAVANKMRLLNLPLEVQEALLNQEISERHARSLLTVKDEKIQIDLLKKVIENRMTVRELDSEIKNMSNMFIPEEFSNNNGNQDNFNVSYNNQMNTGQDGMFMPTETSNSNFINNNQENNAANFNNDGNMFIPQTDPFLMNNNSDNNNNNNNNNNNFVPNDVSSNSFINNTQDTFNNMVNNNLNQNNGGANPFLTSTNYNPPMSSQNENNNFNPFSSIRMNNNNQNTNNNPNPFFVGNNQNNNVIIPEETNNNDGAFNIDDYKLPGVDYSDNESVNSLNYVDASTSVPSTLLNNANLYQYVEDNPNYESVDKPRVVESIDDVINTLKSTIYGMKNGKLRIETEEIDYDDSYQITIRIDKKGDF